MEEDIKFSKRYAKVGIYIGIAVSIIVFPFFLILMQDRSALISLPAVKTGRMERYGVMFLWEITIILFPGFIGWIIGKLRDLIN
jgi:hypothetical protein